MVTEWGMSDKLGPLTFGKKDEQIFLGREIARHKDYSEKTAVDIDEEVKKIVIEAYEVSKNLLSDNRDTLEALKNALLERETMDVTEIDSLVKEIEGVRSQHLT
jgi:cell division protease FtsH